jgi:hypothetical protein
MIAIPGFEVTLDAIPGQPGLGVVAVEYATSRPIKS